MLGQTSEMGSPRQNKEEIFIEMYVREHLIFGVQPPHPPEIDPIEFYLWGHLKNLWCIQLQLRIKRHFNNPFLVPVKPLPTAPRPLQMCDSL